MKESSYFGRSPYKFRTFYLVVLYKFRSFWETLCCLLIKERWRMCACSPPASVNFSEVSKIGCYLDRTPPSPHFFTASLFPPALSLDLPRLWAQILPQSLFSSSEQETLKLISPDHWGWVMPSQWALMDVESYSRTALTFCNDSSQFDLNCGKEQLCLSSLFWPNALEDHP